MRSIKINNVIYIILFILIYVIYLFHVIKLRSSNETTATTKELDSILNPEFKINLEIILEPNGLCKFKSKFIFIYIFTSVKSFTKRQLIRNTWANKSLNLLYYLHQYMLSYFILLN